MLVVVSGLPGTGKSTVAVALARQVRAVHLSIDEVEEAMLGAGLPPTFATGVAAYEAVRAAVEQNLALGHHVVVDAVNEKGLPRDRNAQRGSAFQDASDRMQDRSADWVEKAFYAINPKPRKK